MTLRVQGGPPTHTSYHCVRGHEWTPENTYWNPKGSRHCRTCDRLRRRKSTYAEKALNVTVKCVSCSNPRVVTARTERRIRCGELSGLCPDCRRNEPPVAVTDELLQWWRDRFTPTEIHVLASGLIPNELEWHDNVPTIELREAA
jgi:hypothetical protein